MPPDHSYFATLIWQVADLLRGPYRPPQYERVMLPMTVLRRFDCVRAPSKVKVGASTPSRRKKVGERCGLVEFRPHSCRRRKNKPYRRSA